MTYRFTEAARQELTDAVQWYLDDGGPAPAELFEWAAFRAVNLLAQLPRLGTPAYRGVRTWPLKGFPYTLVYRSESEGITVIAVAHQSRAPGYWRRR